MDLDALIAFAESEFARLEAYRTQLAAAERLLAMFRARAPQDPLTVEAQRTVDSLRGIAQGIETELTGLLERLREEFAPNHLPAPHRMGTLGAMDLVPSAGAAVSAAKTKNPTLFQKHLQERSLSLPEWVATKKRLNLKVENAKAWVKRPGKGGRPVPRIWADRIAEEFEDKALADSDNWPNGIRD